MTEVGWVRYMPTVPIRGIAFVSLCEGLRARAVSFPVRFIDTGPFGTSNNSKSFGGRESRWGKTLGWKLAHKAAKLTWAYRVYYYSRCSMLLGKRVPQLQTVNAYLVYGGLCRDPDGLSLDPARRVWSSHLCTLYLHALTMPLYNTGCLQI